MEKIENFYESEYAYDVTCEELLNLDSYNTSLKTMLKIMEKAWGNKMRVGTVYVYKDETGSMNIHFSERGSYLENFLPDDIPVMDMNMERL